MSTSSLLQHLSTRTPSLAVGVRSGEVGDTWIHGIASDPGRMADYRAVLRARNDCELAADCDSEVGERCSL